MDAPTVLTKHRLMWAAVALAFVGGLLVLAVVLNSRFPHFWFAITFPADLREAALMSVSNEGTVVYNLAQFELTEEARYTEEIVTYTKANGHTVYLARTTEELFQVVWDGEVVATSTYPFQGLSLSPSGSAIAFAQVLQVPLSVGALIEAGSPEQSFPWRVILYSREPHEYRELAVGAAPVFLDETKIRYSSPWGAYVYNTADSSTALVATPARTGAARLESPNQMIVAAFDPVTPAWNIYRIESGEFVRSGTVSEVLISPVLTNEALYDVRMGERGTELWRFPLSGGEGKRTSVFPVELGINRIEL